MEGHDSSSSFCCFTGRTLLPQMASGTVLNAKIYHKASNFGGRKLQQTTVQKHFCGKNNDRLAVLHRKLARTKSVDNTTLAD